MATLCKNCATPLLFDPTKQKVVCPACGSAWLAEEVESTEKAFREDLQAVDASEVYGIDEESKNEFFNCYVYTCGSCGGEISINGTEASTKCIYCGSSSVVFSRISKEKAPEFIIPFQISREQALDRIKKEFERAPFVPKEVKSFSEVDIRGIYVPYWLANAYHVESDVFASEVSTGKTTVTKYWARSGQMSITNLPVDGSQMLSDESSQRLEPFDFSAIKSFDEDYLLGFYSNVSDISNADLETAVRTRARESFREQTAKKIRGNSKRVTTERSSTVVDRDVRYVMLPVWFVCYEFQGKHNTIMVNGQTGKVVCGIPWNQKKFATLVIALSVILTALLFFVIKDCLFSSLLHTYGRGAYRSSQNGNSGGIISSVIVTGLVIFVLGISFYKKVKKQLQLSQSKSIFNFVKKRQG